jgi:hypothetical protein
LNIRGLFIWMNIQVKESEAFVTYKNDVVLCIQVFSLLLLLLFLHIVPDLYSWYCAQSMLYVFLSCLFLIVASVFHYVYIVEGQYGGTKAIIVRRTLGYTKQHHFCIWNASFQIQSALLTPFWFRQRHISDVILNKERWMDQKDDGMLQNKWCSIWRNKSNNSKENTWIHKTTSFLYITKASDSFAWIFIQMNKPLMFNSTYMLMERIISDTIGVTHSFLIQATPYFRCYSK